MIHVGIVGDFDPAFAPHPATEASIGHAADASGMAVTARWVATGVLEAEGAAAIADCDAVWVAPGSPYRSMAGALEAIRHARTGGVPLLGTCGGFQHVVLEYARHVLGVEDAQHAEYDPYASRLFIMPLSCSLAGQSMAVELDAGSRAARAYGATTATERYYCNFGLDPRHEPALEKAGLRIVGRDADGEARVVELPSHPFFVATLFVPQTSSAPGRPHPLVSALLDAARAFAGG